MQVHVCEQIHPIKCTYMVKAGGTLSCEYEFHSVVDSISHWWCWGRQAVEVCTNRPTLCGCILNSRMSGWRSWGKCKHVDYWDPHTHHKTVQYTVIYSTRTSIHVCTCIGTCTCVCKHICTCIHVYVQREREEENMEGERGGGKSMTLYCTPAI